MNKKLIEIFEEIKYIAEHYGASGIGEEGPTLERTTETFRRNRRPLGR